MPVLDAVIIGKIHLPEVGGGPIYPPEGGALPTPPPGLWPPGSGIDLPAHPIAPGGPPPGIWPSPGYPAHPIVLPPGFIDGVHPEHPIVIPPPPAPGHPAHPIVIPPEIWPPDARPEHPIVIPPPPVVYPPRPTHPIVLPDPPTGQPEILSNWDVVAYWTPEGGWAMAIVPSETNPGVPTPARAMPARP